MRKSKVVKLDAFRKAKQELTRDQRFARVTEHLALLEINEFNFVAPDGGGLDMFEPGRAWWHKLAAVFGLQRLPESEAELLGTQQALMFLVMASRPTPWADQDADWLAAGVATIEESMDWAAEWFEAYLEQDLGAMREAMEANEFIERAAEDWTETLAAQEREGLTAAVD